MGCESVSWSNEKIDFFNIVIENDVFPIIGRVNRIVSAAMNALRPLPPLTCNWPYNRQMALRMMGKKVKKNAIVYSNVLNMVRFEAKENGDHWML